MQSNNTEQADARRSTVLNLPLRLAFPGYIHLGLIFSSMVGVTAVEKRSSLSTFLPSKVLQSMFHSLKLDSFGTPIDMSFPSKSNISEHCGVNILPEKFYNICPESEANGKLKNSSLPFQFDISKQEPVQLYKYLP